jgi:hypothetical protein
MTEPRYPPTRTDTAVFISIDHAYIPDELDHVAQGVYDALGSLEIECPEAIELFMPEDFRQVLAAAERWAATGDLSQLERAQLRAAMDRIRHLPASRQRGAWLLGA